MPNCTAYAYGRAYEILQTEPKLCPYGAGEWYNYNKRYNYYDYGQIPKVGAIACWGYNGGGHVAVVESIDNDGNIILSNSAWNNYNLFFYLTYAQIEDSNPGGSSWWTFQGYIYLINNEDGLNENEVIDYDNLEQYKVDKAQVLNIRSGPSAEKYHKIGYLTYGDIFYIDKIENNFGHIINTKSNWVCLDYCTLINKKGDINQDGILQIQDATDLQSYLSERLILTQEQLNNADVNRDNKVNINDVTKIQRILAELD